MVIEMSAKAPKIFLSYARADAEHARQLSSALRARGFETFADTDLSAGTAWRSELEGALKDSDAIVCLLSASALTSPYVRREWEAALTRSWEDPDVRIVPLVEHGVAPPGLFTDLQRVEIPAGPADADWQDIASKIAVGVEEGFVSNAEAVAKAETDRREAVTRLREEIAPLVAAEANARIK